MNAMVRIMVRRGKTIDLPHAFVAKLRESSGWAVRKRVTRKRTPTTYPPEKYNLGDMFMSLGIKEKVDALVDERVKIEFAAQTSYLFDKLLGGTFGR
jgi:dUTPase